jgi:hypothetical protein
LNALNPGKKPDSGLVDSLLKESPESGVAKPFLVSRPLRLLRLLGGLLPERFDEEIRFPPANPCELATFPRAPEAAVAADTKTEWHFYVSVKPQPSVEISGQFRNLTPYSGMTTASHTTAAVVETDAQKPLEAHLESVSSRYLQLVAKVKIIFSKFYDREIPLGYEDQSGFHFGVEAIPSDARSGNHSR